MHTDELIAATAKDIAESLAYGLRFNRGKRTRQADDIMADIAARRLVEHLQRCGFVLMRWLSFPSPTARGN